MSWLHGGRMDDQDLLIHVQYLLAIAACCCVHSPPTEPPEASSAVPRNRRSVLWRRTPGLHGALAWQDTNGIPKPDPRPPRPETSSSMDTDRNPLDRCMSESLRISRVSGRVRMSFLLRGVTTSLLLIVHNVAHQFQFNCDEQSPHHREDEQFGQSDEPSLSLLLSSSSVAACASSSSSGWMASSADEEKSSNGSRGSLSNISVS